MGRRNLILLFRRCRPYQKVPRIKLAEENWKNPEGEQNFLLKNMTQDNMTQDYFGQLTKNIKTLLSVNYNTHRNGIA